MNHCVPCNNNIVKTMKFTSKSSNKLVLIGSEQLDSIISSKPDDEIQTQLNSSESNSDSHSVDELDQGDPNEMSKTLDNTLNVLVLSELDQNGADALLLNPVDIFDVDDLNLVQLFNADELILAEKDNADELIPGDQADNNPIVVHNTLDLNIQNNLHKVLPEEDIKLDNAEENLAQSKNSHLVSTEVAAGTFNGNGGYFSSDIIQDNNEHPLNLAQSKNPPLVSTEVTAGTSSGYVNGHQETLPSSTSKYEELYLLGESSDLVLSTVNFKCPVCMTWCLANTGAILRDCIHTICRNCLIKTIQCNKQAEVKCPYKDDNYECESVLQDREIKGLVSKEMYEKQLNNSLNYAARQFEDSYPCTTPGCDNWCIIDLNTATEIICQICLLNKLKCKKDLDYSKHLKTIASYNTSISIPPLLVPPAEPNLAPVQPNLAPVKPTAHVLVDLTDDETEMITCPLCFNVFQNTHEEPLYCTLCTADIGSLTQLPCSGDKTYTEKIDNYDEMVVADDYNDLVRSTVAFECPVCLAECFPNEGIVLRSCIHSFCKECLSSTIEYNTDAEVKCPYRDENYACEFTLQEREIKALVSVALYEKHLAKSLALAEAQTKNAYHCKTPDCQGWVINENEDDNINKFQCPACSKENCVNCQAIHENLNCKQYQDHLLGTASTDENANRTHTALNDMVKKGKAMHCPQCNVIIQKVSGCAAITCAMCKTDICWATKGRRWGPGGNGDTSGGCRCNMNGRRCHPECNNCH